MSQWKQGLHELLVRVAQKDEEAFSQMFEALRLAAIRMILAEVGGLNEYDADAAYCQAMYKIWRKAETYQGRQESPQPDATAWAWIRTTILHTAQDASRGARRIEMSEISESEMITTQEQEDGPENSPIDGLSAGDISLEERISDDPADRIETRESLQEFMASLGKRERTILDMLAAGLARGEIARRIGVSGSRLSQIVSGMEEKAALLSGRRSVEEKKKWKNPH